MKINIDYIDKLKDIEGMLKSIFEKLDRIEYRTTMLEERLKFEMEKLRLEKNETNIPNIPLPFTPNTPITNPIITPYIWG